MIHSLKQCVDKTYAMNVMLYWLLPWENVPQEMRNIKWISLIEMNFKSSIILTILFDQQPIASTSKTNCNKNYTNDNNNNKWDDSQWNLFFFIANAILLYSFLFINIYGFYLCFRSINNGKYKTKQKQSGCLQNNCGWESSICKRLTRSMLARQNGKDHLFRLFYIFGIGNGCQAANITVFFLYIRLARSDPRVLFPFSR